MERNQNIDELFKQLEGYTEAPPEAVWTALKKRLDEKEKRRGGFFFRSGYMIAAALLLILAAIGGGIWWNSAGDTHNTAVTENTATNNSAADANRVSTQPATDNNANNPANTQANEPANPAPAEHKKEGSNNNVAKDQANNNKGEGVNATDNSNTAVKQEGHNAEIVTASNNVNNEPVVPAANTVTVYEAPQPVPEYKEQTSKKHHIDVTETTVVLPANYVAKKAENKPEEKTVATKAADNKAVAVNKPAAQTPAVQKKVAVTEKTVKQPVPTPVVAAKAPVVEKKVVAKKETAQKAHTEKAEPIVAKAEKRKAAEKKAAPIKETKTVTAAAKTENKTVAKATKQPKQKVAKVVTEKPAKQVAVAAKPARKPKQTAKQVPAAPAANAPVNVAAANNAQPVVLPGQAQNNKQLPVAVANNTPAKNQPIMPAAPAKQTPVPASQPDNTTTKPTNDVATGGGSAGGAGTIADSSIKAHKKFKLAAGMKVGYERGLESGAANKLVVAPYLEYDLSKRFSVMTQPAIKGTSISSKELAGASYYKIDNEQTATVATPIIGTGGVPIGYVLETHYMQSHDSIRKSYTAGGKYVESELPILLKYKVTPNWSVYGGVNIDYARYVQIAEKTYNSGPIVKTADSTIISLNTTGAPPVSSVITNNGQPISSYTGPLYTAPKGAIWRLGYIFGVSYTIKDKWMADLLVEQNMSKQNMQGGYDVNKALNMPCLRLSIGYKFTQDLFHSK